MLAPANSPREILASAQLDARGFFAPLGDVERFPVAFVQVRSLDGEAAPVTPRSPAPRAPARDASFPGDGHRPAGRRWKAGRPAGDGVNGLEVGSGPGGAHA